LPPPASLVALNGFKMGLIRFVFWDTNAISLAFLQKNWLCFTIYPHQIGGLSGANPVRKDLVEPTCPASPSTVVLTKVEVSATAEALA
jgi:hypothetical protein